MASSSLDYFLSYLVLTSTILLLHTNVVSSQSHIWAEDQPSSAYTIYNGKIYPQPKKESSWANLFSFETLYNNPVVQTVLGWTDSFYGSSSSNDTMLGEDFSDSLTSSSHPHHAYAGQPGNNQYSPQNPYNNGYFKNGMPNHPDKFPPNYMPQQQQQQPPNSNNGKYPSYGMPQYPYQQQLAQPMPYRPSQEQQQRELYQQKQLQYQQQLYPQQQLPNVGYGSPAVYGQQPQQQFYGMYGNPNVEIVNQLEAQGSMESIMTVQPQERHYQSSNYQPQQAIQSNPSLSSKNSFDNDLDDKPSSVSSSSYETSTETVKDENSTGSNSRDMLDDYPCPPLNQWKWDGQFCIALGPTPTWACRPNDLVASGRVTICRNKIFFPNEP